MKTHSEQQILQSMELMAHNKADLGLSFRPSAISAFVQNGLPSKRVEDWHYTDLRNKWQQVRALPDRSNSTKMPQPCRGLFESSIKFVFVDGALFVPQLIDGIEVVELSELPKHQTDDWFAAKDTIESMNLALTDHIAIIRITSNIVTPLEIIHVANIPTLCASRVIIILEPHTSLGIIETIISPPNHQPNNALCLQLAPGARASHVRNEINDHSSVSLSSLSATLESSSSLDSLTIGTAAALARRQVRISIKGSDANLSLGGVAMLKSSTHADTSLVVEHKAEGSKSRELYRYAVDEQATGVFQGKIVVLPEAQKTDGRMRSNALLLSDSATMFNKPELEIFADDVQCAHGATCGSLDEHQLFYLMARGIPRKQAESLLIVAFLNSVIEEGINDCSVFGANASVISAKFESEISEWTMSRT